MLSPIRRYPPGSPSLTPLKPGIDRIPTPACQRDAARARADLAPRCLYIKPSGERCGSPAMRGLDLCYYHDRYQPKPGYRNLPCLEDPHSVQCAIQEVIEDMLNGLLDYKKAALALYGLQTAAANLKQMRIAEEKKLSVQRSAPGEEEMTTGRTQGTRRKLEDPKDLESFEGGRLQPARTDAEAIPAFAAEVRGSDVSSYDDIEEIELVAAGDGPGPAPEDSCVSFTGLKPGAPTETSCIHPSLPTTKDQRPTTFIESPRQPQHVTFGLTSTERERMKQVFPDMKKVREEFLSMLTPEERAEVEQRQEA